MKVFVVGQGIVGFVSLPLIINQRSMVCTWRRLSLKVWSDKLNIDVFLTY